MSAREVLCVPSFDESLRTIEDYFRNRLSFRYKSRFFPDLNKPVVMKEWDYLDALFERIINTPATDPAFELLDRLTEKDNYYSFHHYMFRAYFFLDVERNALVGLLVRRGYSDASADLLPELEKAQQRYKEHQPK